MFKARFIEPDIVHGKLDEQYLTFVGRGDEEVWRSAGSEVATVGSLSIWTEDRRSFDHVFLLLFDPSIDRFVGSFSAYSLRTQELSRSCRKGLLEVAEAASRYGEYVDTRNAYAVDEVFVDRRYRRKGAGVALYLAALARGRVSGQALVADRCTGGETSREAKRVWGSRLFREHALVSSTGLAAYLKPISA